MVGVGFDPKIFHIRVVDAKDNIQDMEVGRILGRSRGRLAGHSLMDFDGFHGAGIGRGWRRAIRFYSGGTSRMNQRRPT